jgi:hypothetical protein
MVEIYEKAKTECHYNAARFHQMIQQYGGLDTAKRLLVSNYHPDGLTRLWESKLLDISMEAIVLQESWCGLFTKEELAVAKKRLKDLGYTNI